MKEIKISGGGGPVGSMRPQPIKPGQGVAIRTPKPKGPSTPAVPMKSPAVQKLEAVNPGHTRTQGSYSRPVK